MRKRACGPWPCTTTASWYPSNRPLSALPRGSLCSFKFRTTLTVSLGITSPVQNQLVDLAADQNYAATDAACASPPSTSDFGTEACFSPKTNTGNAISWTVNLQYATSGGLGPITDNRPTFSTQSGTTHNLQYSNEGGQVQVTASTTASDGSTVKDCVTFYVEGPSGGIPNTAITNQLVTLYPASRS